MSVIGSNILSGASGQGGDYTIDQSLRFEDGDSAYLSWTPGSAGNRRTWTWSGWVKRGLQGSSQHLFDAYSDASNRTFINIDNSDLLGFKNVTGGSTDFHLQTTQVLRDSGAWYHILVKYDSTPGTPGSSNVALYINGEQVTALGTESYPSQNDETWVNNTVAHAIGRYGGGSAYFDGYLAEVYFIDGTALDASSFGETDTATNQWKPIEVTGLTYGTNGFYQKYSSTELANSFTDSSDPTAFTPTEDITADVLIIAGGGGGGSADGGGGGAGAVIYKTSYSLSTGIYNITVGSGGAGAPDGTTAAVEGTDSSIGALLVADGGGPGGYETGAMGTGAGGSGGGSPGGGGAGSGESGTGDSGGADNTASSDSGWGNDGGDGYGTSPGYGGAGGGGAKTDGANQGSSGLGGDGGDGLSFNITGADVIYATGGGGACRSGAGTEGDGGSSNIHSNNGGYSSQIGSSAPDNTGSGGGGVVMHPAGPADLVVQVL